DAAAIKAEVRQRAGKVLPPPAARPQPVPQAAPQRVATVPQRGSTGQVARPAAGSSNNMPPPYFEPPPMVSPLGSAAIPPVPNPVRPFNETARMAEETDRAAQPRPKTPQPLKGIVGLLREESGLNPVLKIVLESVLVFGLCLVLYFIIRAL